MPDGWLQPLSNLTLLPIAIVISAWAVTIIVSLLQDHDLSQLTKAGKTMDVESQTACPTNHEWNITWKDTNNWAIASFRLEDGTEASTATIQADISHHDGYVSLESSDQVN